MLKRWLLNVFWGVVAIFMSAIAITTVVGLVVGMLFFWREILGG